jgi:hypothetical protein
VGLKILNLMMETQNYFFNSIQEKQSFQWHFLVDLSLKLNVLINLRKSFPRDVSRKIINEKIAKKMGEKKT